VFALLQFEQHLHDALKENLVGKDRQLGSFEFVADAFLLLWCHLRQLILTHGAVKSHQAIPDNVWNRLILVHLVGALLQFAQVWEHFHLNRLSGDRQVWRL